MNTSAKLSKSCIPCRNRKTKCDAPVRGLPCSSCTRKECPDRCVLPIRKRRETNPTSKPDNGHRMGQSPPKIRPARPRVTEGVEKSTINADRDSSRPPDSTDTLTVDQPDRCADPTTFQSSIHYLDILSQVESNSNIPGAQSDSVTESIDGSPSAASDINHQCIYPALPPRRLDPVDHAFLVGKGVFNLPPKRCIEAIACGYFEFVYPFAPVLDRVEFLQSWRHDHYSLFLMHAVLASGVFYVSPSVVAECGFESRAEAQASFSYKATLLSDFQFESNTMQMLQGSIILGTVASAQSFDKDFHYWFYNALRLITRTDHHRSIRSEAPREKSASISKLYRRMWWSLYCRDVLYSFMGFQRIGLLSRVDCAIAPLSEQDWEVEHIPEDLKSLLKPTTRQQRSTFVSYCSLALTVSQSLGIVAHRREKDVKAVIEPLDTWRSSLREALQIEDTSLFNMSYSFLIGCSYRFECILLRVLRPRWKSRDPAEGQWVTSRLRSAMFELDTTIGKILASNGIPKLPMSFTLCIPILLALHIEIALDEGEPDVTRSVSRISISQSMLLLKQTADIPIMHGIFASFERFLARHRLTGHEVGTVETTTPEDNPEANASQELPNVTWGVGSFAAGWQDLPDFNFPFGDFTGFDFLDN
ncbi:hypothetical protein LCI18_013158 [Fusarium solani-melongenae]|uniref:Uncharacterized protein n=1 Tax=Fusarium solani subsp. cucurbitae TaxID=2747967 RepID=A0ACD3ZMB5_FUSSC|nr:hypothetical protein LCI18_013158 [Fusarium solani-melongenae]